MENISEWIEIEALRAIHEAAPPSVHQALGLAFENIDGVLCSASAREPSILINRCFSSGRDCPLDTSAIESLVSFYRNTRVSRFFLHLDPGSQSENTTQLLTRTGMKKSRAWMKFSRDSVPVSPRNPELQVRKIGPEHAEVFARIVAPCFDMTDEAIPLLAGLANHPDWHLYMGFSGDLPAATGALFMKDRIGYYDWAATHRDFRSRGFQGAVLSALINDAARLNCNSLYTVTGEAVRGDPQHSYKNILRYGFVETYLRENWMPV